MVRSRVGGRMIEALSLRHCHRHDHGLPYAYCRSPTARKARHNGPETPRHRAGIIGTFRRQPVSATQAFRFLVTRLSSGHNGRKEGLRSDIRRTNPG